MDSLEELINEARAEYRRNEMDEPVLLAGTSQMHAERALEHLRNRRWDDAMKEAQIAAGQLDTWDQFLEIVMRIHSSKT